MVKLQPLRTAGPSQNLTFAGQEGKLPLLKNENDEVEPVLAAYQEDITTEKELLQVKESYYRKKYLQRILDKIAGLRNIASRD